MAKALDTADQQPNNARDARTVLGRYGVASAVFALFTGICCVLPMGLMVLGFGGAWVAVFGKISAIAYYVIAGSALLLAFAWLITLRRGANRGAILALSIASILTAASLPLVLYEGEINDYFITLM